MKVTKKEYEEHLNYLSPSQDSDLWIIGGVLRMYHRELIKWGTALRKYNPKKFNTLHKHHNE